MNTCKATLIQHWPTMAACSWLGLVVSALLVLTDYASRPGVSAEAPAQWPDQSALPRDASRWQLLLFAHPHCPCTVATIRELERIVAASRDQITVKVLFWAPSAAQDDWDRTRLRSLAGNIPGVQVVSDAGGRISNQFGAQTSGQLLLYDPQGELRFSGGISTSRGHEGDSPGKLTILRLLTGETAAEPVACVYGCSLRTPVGE